MREGSGLGGNNWLMDACPVNISNSCESLIPTLKAKNENEFITGKQRKGLKTCLGFTHVATLSQEFLGGKARGQVVPQPHFISRAVTNEGLDGKSLVTCADFSTASLKLYILTGLEHME